MKNFNNCLIAITLLLAISINGQSVDRPWAVSFGANAIDTRPGAGSSQKDVLKSFENWNVSPSAQLGLSRYIGYNLSFGVRGSLNRVTKFLFSNKSRSDYAIAETTKLSYYAIDANLRYSFMSAIKSKRLDPFVGLGAGYTKLGSNGFPTVNAGAGITYWLTKNIGLSLESNFKGSEILGGVRAGRDIKSPKEPSVFQHMFSVVYQFGAKDSDKDGVFDEVDACPDVAGLKQFNGCPDTDGDGIIDGSDSCPSEAGLAALNGCPDKDGDNITDKDDACPNVAGLVAFQGCPDSDGDGIADKDDKCPKEVGPKSNGGCPILDTDKDGIVDKEDDCPTVAGLASNKGCPKVAVIVSKEVIEKLQKVAKSILFNPGKATFKNGSAATVASLVGIKEVLSVYPNNKFFIEGHTDSDGSSVANQKLSEERANAIKNFLIEKGIKSENITAKGFGESKPIGSNKTKAGKAKNRRTEIKVADEVN